MTDYDRILLEAAKMPDSELWETVDGYTAITIYTSDYTAKEYFFDAFGNLVETHEINEYPKL